MNFDIGVFQRSRSLHCAQRSDDDDHPALVVARARAFGFITFAHEALKGTVFFEHRIEMCDQQQFFCTLLCPTLLATRCPARPAFAMSSHWTLKPSGSSSARIISDTAFTPSKFIVPEFWFTSRSSNATERSYSVSTTVAILTSGSDNSA